MFILAKGVGQGSLLLLSPEGRLAGGCKHEKRSDNRADVPAHPYTR